jgi:hypothetical protein
MAVINPIKLTSYNSANYTERDSELEHAQTNKLLLSNTSIKINFNNEFTTYDQSVIYNYRGYLDQFCIKIEFPEKYWYKPELISYELYGTVDLWYLILWFNDYPSAADMYGDTIRVFNPSKIPVINNIINVHKDLIESTKEEPQFCDDEILTKVKISSNRVI